MIRAVFGGSFDPVHCGHLLAVREILDRGLADVVHVVPAWLSPHKAIFSSAPEHRLAMANLVFEGLPGLRVESLEMDRAVPAFTVDTLQELRGRYPDDSFRVVMGADQLLAFPDWHAPQKILKLADLIILGRQSGNLEALCGQAGISPPSRHLIPDFDQRVSASAIRARLIAGEDAAAWLDPAVAAYIREHELYLA